MGFKCFRLKKIALCLLLWFFMFSCCFKRTVDKPLSQIDVQNKTAPTPRDCLDEIENKIDKIHPEMSISDVFKMFELRENPLDHMWGLVGYWQITIISWYDHTYLCIPFLPILRVSTI
jgi:hypothetical protein